MGAVNFKPVNNGNLIAQVHIAKQQLGLSDEQYRDLLARYTGKTSCLEMNIQELRVVIGGFQAMGWVPGVPKASLTRSQAAPTQATRTQAARTQATAQATPTPQATPRIARLGRPTNWHDIAKNPMYRKLYALICANSGWSWQYVRGTAQHMFEQTKSGEVVLEWLTGQELHSLVSAMQIASNRKSGL